MKYLVTEKQQCGTHWRPGVVVIASANGTEDRGFESRQGLRFAGFFTLQCCIKVK
jgi:hypothetical protein